MIYKVITTLFCGKFECVYNLDFSTVLGAQQGAED
jgi:hypothetical protein